MSNQSITISQSKRINHFSNLIINNNNTNHISHNTNSNLIPTTSNEHLPTVNSNTNETSLDISNIRQKIDHKLNASSISNNFTRNEIVSTNNQHIQVQQTKKICPIMCVVPTDTLKDDEIISERKDLTTHTFHKKPSKCKVNCERTCIIRFLCIFVISLSLFLFLKWKLHF